MSLVLCQVTAWQGFDFYCCFSWGNMTHFKHILFSMPRTYNFRSLPYMVFQLEEKNTVIFAFYRKEASARGGRYFFYLGVKSGSW